MNLFTCLLNQAVTLSVFNVSPWLFIVLGVIMLAFGIVLFAVRPTISYIDTEGDVVIHVEKHPLFKKVQLHGSAKCGKKLIGWSKVLGKSTPISKTEIRLFRSISLYTIWEDIEVNSAVSVEFNYMDADEDKIIKKDFYILNTRLPDNQLDGVEVEGWSFSPDEAPIITKEEIEATFIVNLYPIFEESPVGKTYVPTNNKAIVDILFTDGVVMKDIYKESHYINLSLPMENEASENFLGWGFAKDGALILDKSGSEAIFTIQLFSKGAIVPEVPAPVAEVVPEVVEEIVEEEIVEEVAPEVVEEVAEEVIEEVAEEVIEEVAEEVIEEVAEEVIEETPEKTAEEAINEVAEIVEEPIPEEEVVEEVVVEEITEEVIVEEIAEEVVEEVAEEVVEEVAEEVIEEVAEEVVEEVAEEVVEEVAEEVVEEVAEEVIEEVTEEVAEEVAEEVIEEVAEEVIEEVAEEVIEEVVAEEVVEEVAPEVVEEITEEVAPEVVEIAADVNPVIVPTYFDSEGNKIEIKLSRSFEANLIQSDDTVKGYYNELRNHILSYKGVKSRFSWRFDSYSKGRTQLFKMKIRGKTICLYCNLDPEEFDKSKYHHEAIVGKNVYKDVPMLVKIKSGLALRKAKELVDIEMAKFEIVTNPKAKEVDYVAQYPYEENEPLIGRGLIKILVPDDAIIVQAEKPQEEVAPEVIEEVAEEVAPEVVEEVVEEVAEEVIEEVAEEVVEEVAEEVIEEVAEEVVEEVAEEVVEEVAEEAVEEVAEEVIEEVVEEVIEEVVEEVFEEHEVIVEEVTAEDADQIVEEQHIEVHVEEGVEYISAKDTKKAIVNVDTLSNAFEAHDVADLASMKAKGLIDKKAKTVKVLARGAINKPLIVKAGDFSRTAIDMIVLTGGNAVHVTYKVKK